MGDAPATPRRLRMRVGERREIDLAEMGAAGYLWDLRGLAGVAEPVSDRRVGNRAEGAAVAVGGAVTRRIELLALAPGRGFLRHARPFEPAGTTPLETVEITVLKPGERA